MRDLRLVGLSADGRRVVLVDDAGNEFATPADDRLLAALRGDRARLGQLEIQMDSALRPRDIQARIRNGESPEAVASLAGVSIEKIMPYCVPVLAERQHIADLAGRSHVRRRNADGPSRRLSEVVGERLRGRGINPDDTEWDAWRREDGRWVAQASYRSGERERTATFVFDAVGRFSLAEDDEAKWLTGERQSTSKGPQPREPGTGAERRLSSVPLSHEEDLVTLAESGGLPADQPDYDELDPQRYEDDELSDDLTAVVRAVRETDSRPSDRLDAHGETAGDDLGTTADVRDFRSSVEVPVADTVEDRVEDRVADTVEDADSNDEHADAVTDAVTDPAAAVPRGEVPGIDGEGADEEGTGDAGTDEAGTDEAPTTDTDTKGSGSDVPAQALVPSTEPLTEPTPERRRRNPRRASVPSWDEIMFGKGKNE
jgi:hypothetical protein